jgi:hypothetical protein
MNRKIQNKDGSPFIVCNRFENPFFLITIVSAMYQQENRYRLNRWLDLKNFKKFENVIPVELKSINSDYTFENDGIPSGYEGDETSGYANIAIFSEKDINGVISYKYWEYNNNEKNDYFGKWVNYECIITCMFTKDITERLIEQNYHYGISLVTGKQMLDELKDCAIKGNIDVSDVENDSIKLYDYIAALNPSLITHISEPSRPLVDIDDSYEILKPTRLTVQSNLKGGRL